MQVTRRQALLTGVGVALTRCARSQIVILTIHGVPDYAHPAVTTPPELFKTYLAYLKENNYNVVSVRDLARYSI
jgi:peptidoglycan-N-acetylglucosamine deacetylase